MKEKYVIIKGVKLDRLHHYIDKGKMFLSNSKYPTIAKINEEYFSPIEWEKDTRSLNITNMWRIINFDWKLPNEYIKYII